MSAPAMSGAYRGGGTGAATCTRCGRRAHLGRYRHDRNGKRRDGLYVDCAACGEQLSSSAQGIADGVADVRAFRRDHARARALAERELDYAGVPAVAVEYQDVLGSARVSVFLARDTLRVLAASTH